MVVGVSRLRVLASSAALCAAALAVPAGATTPISGNLNLVANAILGGNSNSDNAHPSWSGAPTTLTGSVSATTIVNRDSVNVSGSASAAWSGADSGSVEFQNYGWTFADFTAPGAGANLTNGRGGDDWSYTFTASGDGLITLSYDETLASGNPFGLQGWAVDFTGSGSGAPVLNTISPEQSGVFTGMLLAGQTYSIGLNGNPNIGVAAQGDYAGRMDGVFNWKISYGGVPEPSTWAMMLLGVGLLGAAMRMRRGREAAAA